MNRDLLIIGAGPVGLAAALGAVRLGRSVTVLEQGEIGESMRHWGPTRFFSPLAMNLPPGAAEILGSSLPAPGVILTGPEFVESVLIPIANCPQLNGRIKTGHRVVAVGRTGLTKSDFANHPIRAERGFRILADTPSGERVFEASGVIDASGVYHQPAHLGAGGIPAPGERALAKRFIRTLGCLDERVESLAGRTIMLIGHGHSAANAIARLAELAGSAPGTRVIWATRSMNRRPCVEVAADPLPKRQQIVSQANRFATQPLAWLQVERRASIDSLASAGNAKIEITLSGARRFEVDDIIALTGYRPDLSILSELNVAIDPVTEGAARLSRALCNVTDCLAAPSVSPADLESGEPGFYLAGAKSYGRARTFLLQNGYQQLETILSQLDHA